jgi:hypothetical protein
MRTIDELKAEVTTHGEALLRKDSAVVMAVADIDPQTGDTTWFVYHNGNVLVARGLAHAAVDILAKAMQPEPQSTSLGTPGGQGAPGRN